MSWDREVEELNRRRELAARMGGPDRVRRQHERGKLTVRERIEALVDAGSFREFMGLMGALSVPGRRRSRGRKLAPGSATDWNELPSKRPATSATR